MKKVFLHQLRKNLWFDVIMLGCWELFIFAEEDGFCLYNLYLLIILTCIILFRCLIAPKLLYWFRRSQILCFLNKVGDKPASIETLHELELVLIQAEFKVKTIECEDVLDMYPGDIEKLKKIVKEY